MLYLIDGYNLLHKLGLIQAGSDPAEREHARKGMLHLLREFHADESPDVTVIFDAHRTPRGARDEYEYGGIQVRFAARYPEADDLLEETIRQSAVPEDLAVVSDDHRVQEAARRRGCVVMPCDDYMDRLGNLLNEKPPQVIEESPDKPAATSTEDRALWQKEFADLDEDRGMRELFDVPWSRENREPR